MNLIGISISIIHFLMITGVPIIITFTNNKSLLLALFITINISYFLNIYYKNCILTVLEKHYNNVAIIDFYGLLVPQYGGSPKDCNIVAATMILLFEYFCLLKLIKLYA